MSLPYWDYFLSLEADLIESSRYVEFTQANFDAYSIHFARLVMAVSAEIDSVAKAFCKQIDPNSGATNILEYAGKILGRYPKITDVGTVSHKYGITITPWEMWSSYDSPDWWQAYNGIKHNRALNFHTATLKNSLTSLSGLLVLLLYFYFDRNSGHQEEISSFEKPKLLDIVEGNTGFGISSGGVFWAYEIPM